MIGDGPAPTLFEVTQEGQIKVKESANLAGERALLYTVS